MNSHRYIVPPVSDSTVLYTPRRGRNRQTEGVYPSIGIESNNCTVGTVILCDLDIFLYVTRCLKILAMD